MGAIFFHTIYVPFGVLFWFFRMLRSIFLKAIGKTTTTVRKTGGSFIASTHHDPPQTVSGPEKPPVTPPTAKVHNLFFRKLARPRLIERSAADLSLEEARFEVEQAKRFYTFDFSLFPRGDFFYEEVEQGFLHQALGKDYNARDARFIEIMTQFRRILNDNSRRLFLYYTPFIFILTMAAVITLILAGPLFSLPPFLALPGLPENTLHYFITSIGAVTFGLLALMLLYQWPYKVTQQKNLLGLDNYVTSKFARVNQNFLVAKRRSLNVERNKRMSQADELREEAGIWTIAYHWFALRLFLCETLVRNKTYQIRRNTTLYSVSGVVLCIILGFVLIMTASFISDGTTNILIPLTVSSLAFIILAYALVMGRAGRETVSVLQANEWTRFSQIELHESIADHVGEDKLQIVTFRDRNRFE